jgi:hypothetical protein
MSDRVYWSALIVGALASVAVLAGMAAHWVVFGSLEGRWAYHYLFSPSAHVFSIGAIAATAAAAALALPAPQPGKHEWILVLSWVVLALGLQAFIRSMTPFSLESLFVSDGANSFFSVTERYDAATVISQFGRVQRDAAIHAQSNMPGKILLIHALRRISVRPDVLAWLVVLVSNLGGILMYLFVRSLSGDRTIALYATVLYLFVPAKLVFFPLMNTVSPVPLLLCLCVLMRWLRTGRSWYPALLGVALYGLVLFEPLPLVMGLLFAGLAIHTMANGALPWSRFILQTALMLIAVVVTAETVQWLTGFNMVSTFRRIGGHAADFNAGEGRRYAIAIWANLIEFVLSVGLCQAVLFAAALAFGAIDREPGQGRLHHPLAVLCVSLLAILLVTDLIGINRGEVTRLWIFLACLFQIPAAWICARLRRPAVAIAIVVATSIVHATLGTSVVGFVVP